jgi:hypothetical protein
MLYLSMSALYKYRNFDSTGYWRSLVSQGQFWFSAASHLDDDEEVAVQYHLPAHVITEAQSMEQAIRAGSSIHSLGRSCDNSDLWARYGENKSGFCIESDFNNFLQDTSLYGSPVEYTEGNAVAHFDYNLIKQFAVNQDETVHAVWTTLFLRNTKLTQCNDKESILSWRYNPK